MALGKHAGVSDTSLPGIPLLQSQEKGKHAKAEDVTRLLDTLQPCMPLFPRKTIHVKSVKGG